MQNLNGVDAWNPNEPQTDVPECSYCGLELDDDGITCPACGPVGEGAEPYDARY